MIYDTLWNIGYKMIQSRSRIMYVADVLFSIERHFMLKLIIWESGVQLIDRSCRVFNKRLDKDEPSVAGRNNDTSMYESEEKSLLSNILSMPQVGAKCHRTWPHIHNEVYMSCLTIPLQANLVNSQLHKQIVCIYISNNIKEYTWLFFNQLTREPNNP